MTTIKYHKKCGGLLEWEGNITNACGDPTCCGMFEGYICTKCRYIVEDEDIEEREGV
jgi:hypothetical protein